MPGAQQQEQARPQIQDSEAYRYFSDVSGRLTGIETSVASLVKTVDTYVAHTDSQFHSINARLNQPADWRGSLGLGLTAIALLGALVAFVIAPIGDQAAVNEERIYQHLTDGQLASLVSRVNRLEADMQTREVREFQTAQILSNLNARITQTEQEIEQIDQYGSRKWIGDGYKERLQSGGSK